MKGNIKGKVFDLLSLICCFKQIKTVPSLNKWLKPLHAKRK